MLYVTVVTNEKVYTFMLYQYPGCMPAWWNVKR